MNLFDQAIEFHKKGKIEKAEKLYLDILYKDPNHPGANHFLGHIEFSRKKIESASLLFKKATDFAPKIEQYWINYINIFIIQNKLEKAQSLCEKAIKLDSSFYEINIMLGLIFYRLGRLNDSENLLKEILNIKPNHIKAYNFLGITQLSLEKNYEAEKNFKKAIELNPNYASPYNNLGVVQKNQGKLEESEINFKKSILISDEFMVIKQNIDKGVWDLSKENLEKMCIKNIIRSKKIVEVFIDSWCNYCKNQLDQNNLESFLKIFLKLLRIEKRNEKLNDLIKIFFSKFNFSEILNSTRKDERLLLQVAFSQYKFQTGNFLESEKIASKNIEDAKDLIKNETTNDLGWLLVKRSVSLFRNKKIGRDNLDNLLKSLR